MEKKMSGDKTGLRRDHVRSSKERNPHWYRGSGGRRKGRASNGKRGSGRDAGAKERQEEEMQRHL